MGKEERLIKNNTEANGTSIRESDLGRGAEEGQEHKGMEILSPMCLRVQQGLVI